MPRGDRTGPERGGPRTGRGLGYCAGYDAPGYMHPAPGMGRMGPARGFGGREYRGRRHLRGRGWYGPGYGWRGAGYWGYPAAYPAPPTAEEEVGYLQGDLEYLRQELKATEERIAELQKEPEEQI